MMQFNSQHTGTIKTGDLVVIAASLTWLEFGFFLGRGQGGSVQYYSIRRLAHWLAYHKQGGNQSRPHVDFYNTPYATKIARYNPEFFEGEMLELYEKAIEALKLLKIIPE